VLPPDSVYKAFKNAARKAGLPEVRLHDLRHAHAAGLIRANVHAKVVQERLGHASAAFTMQVYGHVSPGMQAEAAEAFASLLSSKAR
jgi:integrase